MHVFSPWTASKRHREAEDNTSVCHKQERLSRGNIAISMDNNKYSKILHFTTMQYTVFKVALWD